MGKLEKAISFVLGLPKTIYFNFHYFHFSQAIRLPVWVSGNVKLGPLGKKGCFVLECNSMGTVKFGFGGSFSLGNKGYLSITGKCHMFGTFSVGRGIQFIVNGDGKFGNHFVANANCIINANSNIIIGDDFLAGWGVTIIDADGHEIVSLLEGEKQEDRGIIIGNHIWICSDAKLLKGTGICNDSIVAANALITKSFSQPNILIGGTNKVLKENVTWKW